MKTIKQTDCVIIEPEQTAQAAVIWLHGLGADGHDFVPIVANFNLDPALAIRFIFPHAPTQPVTINNGMTMRAWYDITGQELLDRQDKSGIMASCQQIYKLLDQQHQQGIAYQHMVLAGFSQGGAIALYAGLQYQHQLAGIIGLSTYLPLHQHIKAQPTNLTTPIFMAHGSADPVVLPQWGELSKELLLANGYQVSWQTYPMMHAVCPQEINDVATFLHDCLTEQTR